MSIFSEPNSDIVDFDADLAALRSCARRLFPDPVDRHMLFWTTPRRLFGFGEEGAG